MTDTLRGCIVAEEGYTFICLDASQIELRVLAIMSGDPQMLADLATGDIHQATADRMKVSRYDGKQGNFAMVYGADEYKLSTMLNCTIEEALAFISEHKRAYPRLHQWMDEQIKLAKKNGYVVNMFGRIRPIPELSAGSFKVRKDAEREVVNTIVQGSAVDIVKIAGLYLRRMLDYRVRFLLQVHDEWLFECPNDIVDKSIAVCKSLITYLSQYPFKVSIGTVYNKLEEVK